MFNKTYTIIMNSDNTEEAFKEVTMRLSKFGTIKRIKEVKDWKWTIIELKTNVARWTTVMSKLKKDLDITPVKLNNMWFI